jgi:hypothetical protein
MDSTAAIIAVYRRLCDVYAARDVAGFAELLAPSDVRCIGTDPSEWWGLDVPAIVEIHRQQFAEQAEGEIRPSEPEAFVHLDVGWLADRPVLFRGDGSTLELRFTAVLVNFRGEWRYKQMHLSVGAPNDEFFGHQLTTHAG